jgi:muramoyltetrapeptide carboxypeptidase LdcA involved in peptidoglycan recycling
MFKEERMIPSKLRPGDHIRVVSPAGSLAYIPVEQRQTAINRLAQFGLTVSYSEHAEERDRFESSSVPSRLADLHAAFADPAVNGIMTTLGGYNSNQLLHLLDFELIGANPKVFCGYSDITALSNAIYARTGLVTYSGPHFSTLAMQRGLEYTLEYFQKCVVAEPAFTVEAAPTWSDDAWYADQQQRAFIPNAGYLAINEGHAEGTLLGGNLGTFLLLHGTAYMPPLTDSILLLEEDAETKIEHFDRYLQALLHQPGCAGVRGLIIGRFQKASSIDDETLITVIKNKPELARIPVVVHASFGHTTPQFTFPIGGRGTLVAERGAVQFSITEH